MPRTMRRRGLICDFRHASVERVSRECDSRDTSGWRVFPDAEDSRPGRPGGKVRPGGPGAWRQARPADGHLCNHFSFRGSNTVSKYTRKLRLRGLVVATAMAFAGTAVSAAEVHLDALRDGEQYDRFIVKFRDSAPEAQNAAALQRALERASVGAQQMIQAQRAQAGRIGGRDNKPLEVGHLRRLAVGGEVVRSSRKLNRAEAQELMRQLAANPNVEYVEVDQLMKPVFTPNDTHYGVQWGYFNATGGIRADQAWDVTTGSGVVVAVLDTGITNHSDLNANVIAGYDFISDSSVAGDGNGRDSDPSDPGDYYGGDPSSWHGTHVAGTVAAVTNNAKGVAGTAPGAKVQPVRVLGRGGG